MQRLLTILAIFILTTGFLPLLTRPQQDAEKDSAGDGVETSSPGVRVFVDPETGELVSEPTDEQLGRLRAERLRQRLEERRSSWDLREFGLPGGGHGVALDGWGRHELEVRRSADGGWQTVCSQGEVHHSHAAASEPGGSTEPSRAGEKADK